MSEEKSAGEHASDFISKVRDKISKRSQEMELQKLAATVAGKLADIGRDAASKGSAHMAALIPFLNEEQLLKWTGSLLEGAATAYDRAMDGTDINPHVAGGTHRLFDGGHTIAGSWEAAKNALPDDSHLQEIAGWAHAYMKDLTTTNGMPFFNLDRESYAHWVDAIASHVRFVDKAYFYDLVNFDVMELLGSAVGVVGVLFALKKDDKAKLCEILGSMGIASIISANPIMGISVIACTAYAIRNKGGVDYKATAKGAGIAAMSKVIFMILGLPVLVELAVVLVVTSLVKKHVFDNAELAKWLHEKILEVLSDPESSPYPEWADPV